MGTEFGTAYHQYSTVTLRFVPRRRRAGTEAPDRGRARRDGP
jgi:hypothetical protein